MLGSSGHWKNILPANVRGRKIVISIIASCLAILLALIAVNALSFIAALAHWRWSASTTPLCTTCFMVSLLFATILAAMSVPSSMIPQLAIRVPSHWPQLTSCNYLHFVDPPLELFPEHAGRELSADEQIQRRDYFCSAILWLLMAGFAALKLLTWWAKACRAYQPARSGSDRSGQYESLGEEDPDSEAHEIHMQPHGETRGTRGTIFLPWYQHLAVHLSCAIPSVLLALAGRLDVQAGVCWEVYLLWLFAVFGSTLPHAICLVVSLPMHREVPDFAGLTISSVLPVVGERLDTFKDWLFVALALSKRTLLSFLLASLGIVILLVSNVYMRAYHAEALARFLMPEWAACYGPKKEGFLTSQTSPAKLAIAVTEDLPQACLQTLFVALYGGSSAQSLFIAISCTKIALCLGLRSLALEREGRYGDSYEAAAEFYRSLQFMAGKLGLHATLGLWAQTNLAKSLGDLGRHEEALDVYRKVLQMSQGHLGPGHPDIVTAKANVAWSLGALGEHEEAKDLLHEVVTARTAAFGSRDADTLDAEAALAWNLTRLKRYDSALQRQEKIFNIRSDMLGQQHEDTLSAQANLAWTFGRLDRHAEALALQEEVFAERRKLLGEWHPDTLRARFYVAVTLRSMGRYKDALKHQREVLAGRKEVLTPKHPDIVRAGLNLALVLGDLGLRSEAMETSLELVAVGSEVLGADDEDVICVQESLESLALETAKPKQPCLARE